MVVDGGGSSGSVSSGRDGGEEGEILDRSPHPHQLTHTTITTTLALVVAQPPHSPQQPCASPGPAPGVEKHAHLPQPGRWK